MKPTRYLKDRVLHRGDKAAARHRLYEDMTHVGLPCPEVLSWDGAELLVERVRGVTLKSARRYRVLDNIEIGGPLAQLCRVGVESGCIVEGLQPADIIFTGEVWVLTSGRYVRGVTDKRARRFWRGLCKRD